MNEELDLRYSPIPPQRVQIILDLGTLQYSERIANGTRLNTTSDLICYGVAKSLTNAPNPTLGLMRFSERLLDETFVLLDMGAISWTDNPMRVGELLKDQFFGDKEIAHADTIAWTHALARLFRIMQNLVVRTYFVHSGLSPANVK